MITIELISNVPFIAVFDYKISTEPSVERALLFPERALSHLETLEA